MAHPLARLLPDEVRAEARAITTARRGTLTAPLRTMQFRFRTAELLRDAPAPGDQPEAPDSARAPATPPALTRRGGRHQMELPLSA
ncbi:MAG: hypothetical protein WD771_00860 [Gemmatimonadaceae bacterium]